MTFRRPRTILTIVFVIAPLVFLAMIGKRDIVTSHEARVAQTARQMAAVGWPWEASARVEVPVVGLVEHDGDKRLAPLPRAGKMTVNPWLVPVINGQIRLQKPPLPYWCTAVVFKVFGVGEGRARLVPAILGALMILLIADVARMVLGRRAMLPAAIVWATTLFVADEFRKSMADPYLAFFTLACVYSWLRGGRFGTIVFYVSLGLGMIAKGPPVFVPVVVALVLARMLLKRPAGGRGSQLTPSPGTPGEGGGEGRALTDPMKDPHPIPLPEYRQRGKIRPQSHWVAHVVGSILLFAIAAPWTMYVTRAVPNALALWWYELDNSEKPRAFALYAGTLFVMSGLWTPMWIAGMVLPFLRVPARGFRALLSPRNRRRLFATGWLLVVALFFSIKSVKKDAYLLPVAAASVLISADAIALVLAWSRRDRATRGMNAVLALMQAAIAIGFSAAMLVLCWRSTLDRNAGVALSLVALIVSIVAVLCVKNARRWLVAQGLAFALCVVVFVGFYMPDRENARSPKQFAQTVARLGIPLWKDQMPEEVTFYLPLDVRTTDELDVNESRAIVLVDDARHAIDRGQLKPDETFFRAYVRDVPIVGIRRIPIEEGGGGRWKAYELTLDRARARAHRRGAEVAETSAFPTAFSALSAPLR